MAEARHSILVVDGDPRVAEDLVLRCQELGYDCTGSVSTIEEAMRQLASEKPDLLLMDIELGLDEDGAMVTAESIYAKHTIPMVFMIAHCETAQVERYKALAMPDFGYLVKPVSTCALRIGIELALQRARENRNLQENLDEQQRSMRALADSNVRMLLVTETIRGLQEAEAEFYASDDFSAIYHRMVEQIMYLVDARYGALGLFDDEGRLQEFIHVGISEAEQQCIGRLPEGKGLLGAFYHEGRVVRIDDIRSDHRSVGFPDGHPVMHSLLGMPLRFHDKQLGVLYLADKLNGHPFTQQDEDTLELFTTHLANLLERNQLVKRLRQEHEALLKEKREHQQSIAELRKAQQQLLQSEKLASIGQLAAGVAHEINNPVGYINSNIGSLRRYLDDLFRLLEAYEDAGEIFRQNPDLHARIEKLRQEMDIEFLKEDINDLMRESEEGVFRVKQIVQDLKDFSRVDEAEWQWADLHQGLDSTLNIVHNELKYKAEVIKEYGDLPPVECVASQLNQVFMNMLVNAAHAIEERGTIIVRTGHEGEQVWVEFEDNGKGIREEDQSRIFDPFFTTKPVGKGTGLGLSLSYGIVQKHGGTIELDSEPGRGTRFRIWLPVRQPEPRADECVAGHAESRIDR